ncbi:MAG: EAL domain-containing protein [Lachnospiraceae bacterium]|nr:EAL domain-containing protein [Lachnospiraceae bacterium]
MRRLAYVYIFGLLMVALAICGFISYRSKKPIGKRVGLLCFSFIPPALGNMIIVGSITENMALAGSYLYYIGMDIIMLSLIGFTRHYCIFSDGSLTDKRRIPVWLYAMILIDIAQLLLNPIYGHAFSLQKIDLFGTPYFLMVSKIGQAYHRIVCYGIVAVVMAVFIIMCIRVPKIYRERYAVILFSLIVATVWQTVYIFSRMPINRSIIGFAFFAVATFYFSICHRPVHLLDSMLARIVSEMKVAVFLYDPEGRCIWVNRPGRELTKISGRDYERAGDELTGLFGGMEELSERTDHEFTAFSGGKTCYYLVNRGRFFDEEGRVLGSYVNVRDNTAEKQRVEQELFQSNHDMLTGLYTREHLFRKINERLKHDNKADYYIALVDISDFKIVNDVFGKEFGDYALKKVADWIRLYSDESCIYGRLVGDNFGSCLPKKLFIPELINRDLSRFKVKMGNTEQPLMIHVGFCEIGEEDNDVSILFDRARLALSTIKNDYKTHVAFYDRRLRERVRWNQEISSELHTAIEENQIVPFLQPIADRSGNIVGAEALARWIHPKHGFMNPGDFIPLFEENGMIVDLDKHIWKSVCGILKDWKEKHPGLFISVNVSPKDFYLTNVLSDIKSYVEESGINPKDLRIEVTETSMMNDTDMRMKVLEEFRKSGFIVEMDDFGSGFSSLNMLKDMPVDVLKIDMKFLSSSKDNVRANTIVKNIIKLSDDLGILSLTEGVETMEQFDMLSDMGCVLFQGYYFAKPVKLSEFEEMLAAVQGA